MDFLVNHMTLKSLINIIQGEKMFNLIKLDTWAIYRKAFLLTQYNNLHIETNRSEPVLQGQHVVSRISAHGTSQAQWRHVVDGIQGQAPAVSSNFVSIHSPCRLQ